MSYFDNTPHYYHPQSEQRSLPPVNHEALNSTMASHDYYSPSMSQYTQSSMAPGRSIAPAMSYSVSSDSNCSRRTTSSTSSTYYHTDSNTSYSHSPMSYSGHHGSPAGYSARDNGSSSPQIKSTSSRSSRQDSQPRSSPRYICVHPGCESSFSRPADLSRHQVSVHFRDAVLLDCPKPRCSRKGDQGFSRQDHLIEHLRQFHCMKLAKRSSKSERHE